MSHSANYLHSHSALERTLKDKDIANKSHVLVDSAYAHLFESAAAKFKTTTIGKITYFKIPTLLFVQKGGVFKNFQE